MLRPADISPDVHVTVHEKHYDKKSRPKPLKQGYCVAKRIVDKLPSGCEEFQNTTNFQLFDFELLGRRYTGHLKTWCRATKGHRRCTNLIETHYKNVGRYYRRGLYDLDLQRVSRVEKAASEVNVSCPHIFYFN